MALGVPSSLSMLWGFACVCLRFCGNYGLGLWKERVVLSYLSFKELFLGVAKEIDGTVRNHEYCRLFRPHAPC